MLARPGPENNRFFLKYSKELSHWITGWTLANQPGVDLGADEEEQGFYSAEGAFPDAGGVKSSSQGYSEERGTPWIQPPPTNISIL